MNANAKILAALLAGAVLLAPTALAGDEGPAPPPECIPNPDNPVGVIVCCVYNELVGYECRPPE